jgi:phosphoglycerate dehydrogenase-like enzyme
MMKRDAFLVNIGRGSLLDEPSLIEALQNNLLGGAGLDVTENEPLESNSPLWDRENVLIPPHSTPKMQDSQQRCFSILEENVNRYREDRPLLNEAKPCDIYTK